MTPDILAKLIQRIDRSRTERGFLSVARLLERGGDNTILDPFSTLISEGVELGVGNLIYPNVILETRDGGRIRLGDDNQCFPGTFLLADGGEITVGNGNELGDGGLRIKALTPDVSITVGSNGRYTNNAEITGVCMLGSGSQIIGQINAQNCRLGAGGSYKEPDPDLRGGVLKGFGRARNLDVAQGEVINGYGTFDMAHIERQTAYHPK